MKISSFFAPKSNFASKRKIGESEIVMAGQILKDYKNAKAAKKKRKRKAQEAAVHGFLMHWQTSTQMQWIAFRKQQFSRGKKMMRRRQRSFLPLFLQLWNTTILRKYIQITGGTSSSTAVVLTESSGTASLKGGLEIFR